jgi:ribosome-binding protein aMBF1 (putative translation factor)
MKICFKCGISENKAMLFNVISKKGIVQICRKCSFEENMPIIKKPSLQPKETEDTKKPSVYERLSNISGVNLRDKKSEKEKELVIKQETNLRDIIDKNFETQIKDIKKKVISRHDLVDNFHWIIMRARRLKHLTQKQLAEAIAEPETAIKKIEEGFFPENNYHLTNKLENYLGIRLMKKESYNSQIQEALPKEKEIPKEINFNPLTTKTLTISDLQEMKKKKETEIIEEDNEIENYTFNEDNNPNSEDTKETKVFK